MSADCGSLVGPLEAVGDLYAGVDVGRWIDAAAGGGGGGVGATGVDVGLKNGLLPGPFVEAEDGVAPFFWLNRWKGLVVAGVEAGGGFGAGGAGGGAVATTGGAGGGAGGLTPLVGGGGGAAFLVGVLFFGGLTGELIKSARGLAF